MDTDKVLQVVRRFDLELVREGRYVAVGAIAYNKDFVAEPTTRE